MLYYDNFLYLLLLALLILHMPHLLGKLVSDPVTTTKNTYVHEITTNTQIHTDVSTNEPMNNKHSRA